jgi:hypothetical protein
VEPLTRVSLPSEADRGVMIEARVDLPSRHENPFDPGQIAVEARVRRPSGPDLVVPAFFTREVERSVTGGRESLRAVGEGYFALRFTPTEAGHHEFTFVARDASGQGQSIPFAVEVRAASPPLDASMAFDGPAPPSPRPFVRIDPDDPRGFILDDGRAFVPFGANIAWSTDPAGGADIERYIDELAAAGLTWGRLWLTGYGQGFALEGRTGHHSGLYAGLGRYSLEVAHRLDRIFARAARRGVYLELVLWQHAQFETSRWSSWAENPYNARLGGPATSSAAFFASPEVTRLARRELRYLVARYGAYPSLFAWEIMNEQDGIKAPPRLVSSWCEDRARDLRALDPFRHLIGTSHLARPSDRFPRDQESDAYDLVQAHAYGSVEAIPRDAAALGRVEKPMILAEFGLDPTGAAEQKDPSGRHLVEASWLALASGFQGGAMSWWWDGYLRPHDLWKVQAPVIRVSREIDWRGRHQPVRGVDARTRDGAPLGVVGREGESGAFVLLRPPSSRWDSPSPPELIELGQLRWSIPYGREALAAFFDTETGALVGLGGGPSDGVATVKLPPFRGSLAVELWQRPAPVGRWDGGG